jgi:hypothetical protein
MKQAANNRTNMWAKLRPALFIAAVLGPALITVVLLRAHLFVGLLIAGVLLVFPFPAKLLMVLGDHLFITKRLERLYP